MAIYCEHKKIYNSGKNEYYLFTLSVPVSLIYDLGSKDVDSVNKNGCVTYYATLYGSKDKITFTIGSHYRNLKCFISICIGAETSMTSNSLNAPTNPGDYCYYDLLTISSEDENFKKLKQHPNDNLVFICKIIKPGNSFSTVSLKKPVNTSSDCFNNLKALAAALKNSSESSNEKVLLRVGEETEVVSKAVLCARSPVFAKMFENDMKELYEKTVTITDIKLPVLRAIISFLYTGQLRNGDSDTASNGDLDFEFLCDLYYASDKYDITDLRQLCFDLLLPKISMENILPVLKMAFSHNDIRLKSTVLGLIATNIETWVFTNEWKNLINDEPAIAAEVLNFF